jgi:hypothetical protein
VVERTEIDERVPDAQLHATAFIDLTALSALQNAA